MAWEGSTRRARLPSDWDNEIVPRILARDRRICHVCGEPGADEVDHIQAGDDHRDENLGAIHGIPCHRTKTGGEGARAAYAKRGSMRRPPEPHPGMTGG